MIVGFDGRADENLNISLEEVTEVSACLVLRLEGSIERSNHSWFEERIAEVIDHGYVRLIMQMERTRMTSDFGVSSVMVALKLVRTHGGDLVLCKVPPKSLDLFRLFGCLGFFTTFETLPEAVEYFVGANNRIVPGIDDEKDSMPGLCLQTFGPEPPGLVLHLSGFLEGSAVDSFLRGIIKITQAGFTRLICDCGGLIFTLDMGFFAFRTARETLRSHGGDLALLHLPIQVREAIELLGLTDAFNIKESLAEAVACFPEQGGRSVCGGH